MLKSRKRKKCPPGCVKKPIRKVSRKRRSVKRKASRKMSRKRKSTKKKASRKRRSTKNKFRVKDGKPGTSRGPGRPNPLVQDLLRYRRSVQRHRAARRPTIMTPRRPQQQRPTPMTQSRLRAMRERRRLEQMRQQNSQREQQWIQLDKKERRGILFGGDGDAVDNAQAALNAAAAAGKVDRYYADNWNAHILLGPDGKFRRPNPNDRNVAKHESWWGDWGPKQEEAFQFLNQYLRQMGGPQGRGSSRSLGLYRYRDEDNKVVTTKVQIAPHRFRKTRLVPTICMLRTHENLLDKKYGDCDVLGQKKRVVDWQREYEEM